MASVRGDVVGESNVGYVLEVIAEGVSVICAVAELELTWVAIEESDTSRVPVYAVDASFVDDAELPPGRLAGLLIVDHDEGDTREFDSDVVPTSKSVVLAVLDLTTIGFSGPVLLLDFLPPATIPPMIATEIIRAARKTAMRRLLREERHLLTIPRERWSTA